MKHPTWLTLLLALAIVAAALECQGCYSCTLKLCHDRLELRIIQNVVDPTADGIYDIEFSWPGGGPRTVSFEVGSASGVTGADPVPGQGWPDWWGLERIENNQLYVNIAPFIGDELDTDGLYEPFVDAPASVEVIVRSGEYILAHENLFPEYEWYWCNHEKGKCDDRKNYRTIVNTLVAYPPENDSEEG